MKYLFIAFLFISSFISGQGIEPTSFQPTQYQGGILRGVIPYVDEFTGETLYIYQHVDSLVFIKDSIYVRNDSIFLRDGTGFAIVTDSIYVVTGATKDTIRLRDGSGFALVDKALPNPPDSTVIVDGWGITSVELPPNTYNIMADSSQVATPFDLSLKQNTMFILELLTLALISLRNLQKS